MSKAGLVVYLCLVGLSHLGFGIFSAKPRFSKPVTYICYALLFPIWGLIVYSTREMVEYRFAVMFIGIFSVYILAYLILSKGSVIKNAFLVTTYLTFIIIYFGITFAACFIKDFNGYVAVRWCIMIPVFVLMQFLIYKVLVPQFKITRNNIQKGWWLLLVSNILYLFLLFMQIFWPFHLRQENLWSVMAFLICAFEYCLIFIVIFHSFSTTISYNVEKTKNNQLEEIAKKDSLTELYNRYYFRLFCDTFTHEQPKLRKDNVAVIVMDINKFKSINDTFGHARGDEILKGVAQELQDIFHEDIYTVFRFGGDEFVVTTIDAIEEEIADKIARFRANIKRKLDITVAAGTSFVDYTNIDPIMTAFKNADKVMYQDKMER